MSPKVNETADQQQPELEQIFTEPGQVQAEAIPPTETVVRAGWITDEHLTYLDELRKSGRVTMFGARPYLQRKFPELLGPEAAVTLAYWMETFEQRTVAQKQEAI